MKICAACVQELPQTSFSKKQWQLKQYQRRCKECIDANRVVQLTAPPTTESNVIPSQSSPSTEDEGPSCWICLEEGPNEVGQPLRRDCSCRGESAGFAHLSCIVQYAQAKSRSAVRATEFSGSWEDCPSCKQPYQNELALDLANEFVAFAEGLRTYPNGRSRLLKALDFKHGVLLTHLQPKQEDEAKQIEDQIISLIEQMRAEGSPVALRLIQTVEVRLYHNLGIIALNEGTEEGARTAVEYFEKSRDIVKALGHADNGDGVAMIESKIAVAKAQCERMTQERFEDLLLEQCQTTYLQYVAKYGQEDTLTMYAGARYCACLRGTARVIEAERLLTRLAAAHRRVNGTNHRLTKDVESDLQSCKVRHVAINYQDEWIPFQALEYEGDGKKCVVQGPLQVPRNVQEEKTFTVDTEDILYLPGTPVVCIGGEGSLEHLNGKIGDLHAVNQDTGFYEVHFQDNGPCSVHHENIRVLFEVSAV